MRALEAGKHVFVEKPLCLTLSELTDIEAAFKQASEQASSAPINNGRFQPSFLSAGPENETSAEWGEGA